MIVTITLFLKNVIDANNNSFLLFLPHTATARLRSFLISLLLSSEYEAYKQII